MQPMQASTCPLCGDGWKVFAESSRWKLVRHADPSPLAGWMMIVAREHRAGPDALDDVEQSELGQVISAVAGAARLVTGCERTYLISFNEAVPHVHVHVVPRFASDPTTTSWALADRYRATTRGESAAVPTSEADHVAADIGRNVVERLAHLGFRTG
jgi:diadenosine tetraphosphate (Ap4A) HIT family hydrolase